MSIAMALLVAVPFSAFAQVAMTPSLSLSVGSQGTAVTVLQTVLIQKGYLASGSATGYFGAATQAAVKAFQAANGLPQTGIFTVGSNNVQGFLALGSSSPTPVGVGLGASGSQASSVQSFLISDGYLNISAPTGYFGVTTQTAVEAFQKANGLAPTGVINVPTFAAISHRITNPKLPVQTPVLSGSGSGTGSAPATNTSGLVASPAAATMGATSNATFTISAPSAGTAGSAIGANTQISLSANLVSVPTNFNSGSLSESFSSHSVTGSGAATLTVNTTFAVPGTYVLDVIGQVAGAGGGATISSLVAPITITVVAPTAAACYPVACGATSTPVAPGSPLPL